MNIYLSIKQNLQNNPKVWLVTGVAGFIGSNLAETLLKLNQKVISRATFKFSRDRIHLRSKKV